ncbi:MAG: hypothetical protein ABSG34_06455 [Candidatus Sulfotelmatobacter sp.]|jgi:hypothetical protein
MMLKLNVLKTAGISAAIGLFIPIAVAQQPAATPSGPVPSQILHAKKIFIVNAEGDNDARISKYVGGTNGIYDQFYADVKNLGRFELVSAPADADVVFEVTLTVFAVVPGYPRFRLLILDPKTNILLWTMSEPVDSAMLAKTARKNIAHSLAGLTQDISLLIPKE